MGEFPGAVEHGATLEVADPLGFSDLRAQAARFSPADRAAIERQWAAAERRTLRNFRRWKSDEAVRLLLRKLTRTAARTRAPRSRRHRPPASRGSPDDPEPLPRSGTSALLTRRTS